jgi:hypothetical protein
MSNSNIENVMNQPKEETISNDDGNDSDESISTEELNALQSDIKDTFKKEEEPVKEVESIDSQNELKKKKVKKISKKELEEQKKLLEEQLKNYEDEGGSLEPEPIKKRGRPKKSEEEKTANKTILKEKVIYMIPNENGGYNEVKNAKPLSKRHLDKLENEKEIQKKEVEIGKRIVRTKKGKADERSIKPRTEKQIAHSKKLVEIMSQRRLEKKQNASKNLKDNIKQAVVEIVTKPIEEVKKELPNYIPPQKSINQQYNDFFS